MKVTVAMQAKAESGHPAFWQRNLGAGHTG